MSDQIGHNGAVGTHADPDADWLYRGTDRESAIEELEKKRISGGDHNIITGAFYTEMATEKDYLDQLGVAGEWERTEAAVTGGATDDIKQTRRFRDGHGIVFVLDADSTPFEPVRYRYSYYNDNPGVLAHVLFSQDAELRDGDGDLFGTLEYRPAVRVEDDSRWKISHDRDSGLPATSIESTFAYEREWVAPAQKRVSLRGAIEGVVSLQTSPTETDLPSVYTDLFETLPLLGDIYVLDVNEEPEGETLTDEHIDAAYGPEGFVDPMDVPPKYRNG